MDNLRRSIRILFTGFCPDKVLNLKDENSYIDNQSFLENGFHVFSSYSLDEIGNVCIKLDSDWFLINDEINSKSVFNILTHFNSKIVVEENLEPFIIFEHLLKWRDLSYYVGEDLLTCSHFAYSDTISQRKRDFFSWRSTAFSNNKQLRTLLKKGLAENHFHLKGSGPVFDLSWINLMNNINRFEKEFLKLEREISLFTKISNSSETTRKSLKILIYKAAYIRLKLFNINQNIELSETLEIDLSKDSNSIDSNDLIIKLNELNLEIGLNKKDCGHRFKHFKNTEVIDYAIPKNIHAQNLDHSYIFYGERKFLYDCFKKVYSNDKDFKKYHYLFHSYLLIKAQFRAELIQINDKVGFGNFSKYQDRKEFFLPDHSIYHTAFVNLAVHNTLTHSKIQSFEVRIAPKEDYNDLRKSIKSYNTTLNKNAIQSEKEFKVDFQNLDVTSNQQHFYTIHYIKKEDKLKISDISNYIDCRHLTLRKEIKNQSIAISALREKNLKYSESIRGIDAASSEFAASPEVFAQGFRYLKNHKLKGTLNHLKEKMSEHKIYATYHAGEDFYDVLDGLRAIDECVLFLNLSQGDRIGHALALGIDVREYYGFKNYKLMLPKQTVLDNTVWLLAKIRKYGISICRNEVNRLERLYEILFYELYQQNFDDESEFKKKYFHQTVYFDAWKLRGDDPYLYFDDLKDEVYSKVNLTYWERCRINDTPVIVKNVRNNIDVKFLYQQYHFNPKIKEQGKMIKQLEISHDYILLVEEVQKKMMHAIASLNIGIECNPTSNYLIGTFKRYAKHPITKFFNLGLEMDHDRIKDCPQLSVSINTDDQGIFSTSLENEYALMAIALEKEKDEFGKRRYNSKMISEWLDKIRQMGIEQSFFES
jgi:adenosine deaminase